MGAVENDRKGVWANLAVREINYITSTAYNATYMSSYKNISTNRYFGIAPGGSMLSAALPVFAY